MEFVGKFIHYINMILSLVASPGLIYHVYLRKSLLANESFTISRQYNLKNIRTPYKTFMQTNLFCSNCFQQILKPIFTSTETWNQGENKNY